MIDYNSLRHLAREYYSELNMEEVLNSLKNTCYGASTLEDDNIFIGLSVTELK